MPLSSSVTEVNLPWLSKILIAINLASGATPLKSSLSEFLAAMIPAT